MRLKPGPLVSGKAAYRTRSKLAETRMTTKKHRSTKAKSKSIAAKRGESDKTASKITKKQIGLDLLSRPEGASIQEMQQAMGWQSHSVRGFLAGTVGKMTVVSLRSEKSDQGVRRYRIVETGQPE